MSFSEWKEVKLGEVISFKNGKKKPSSEGEVPVYGGNGVLGFTNEANNQNTVIIGRVGAYCGSVYYEPGECWISDNAISAQPVGDNNVKYAYYVLKSLKLNERRIGTGQPLLTQGILNSISTIYPSPYEQQAIVATLSSLDDKIELNNRISKNLEEIAQAIFKSWFVDFEPFQDGEFEDSELGRIPKGWRVGSLEENCHEIVRGFTSKYADYSNIKNLNQKVNKGSFLDKQYYKYLREDIDIPSNKFARRYDILLNSLGQGTLGRVHLFTEYDTNIVVDQHITIIRADDINLTANYLYLLLSSLVYQNKMEGLITGSTGMLMLNISKVRTLNVMIPPINVLNEFELIIKSLMETRANLNQQSATLSVMMDSLIPKLITGDIQVPIEEVQ